MDINIYDNERMVAKLRIKAIDFILSFLGKKLSYFEFYIDEEAVSKSKQNHVTLYKSKLDK